MAIVTQPLGSSEARGSVGGLTYNTWRGRHTVKSRSGPSREPTADQLYVLGLGKSASLAWGGLTNDQRAAWNQYGSEHVEVHWTGQPKRLSGHSWFVRCWVRATLVGETPGDWPPTSAFQSRIHITGFAVIGGVPQIFWAYNSTDPDITTHVEAYMCGPLSAGRSPSLHDADRKWYATYPTTQHNVTAYAPGTYTIWIRPVGSNGMVAGWSKFRFVV